MSLRRPVRPSLRRLGSLLVAALSMASACTCSGALQQSTRGVTIPPEVDLGETWVDTVARGVLPVRSTGTGSITVVALVAEGVVAGPQALPAAVGGGGVLEIPLAWQPTGVGVLQAFVDVTTDLDATPVRVTVRASAVAVPTCADEDPCTDDTFDRTTRACRFTRHDRACDDGSACTTDDRCEDGTCRGRALSCDDGDTCTLDFCDPAAGCIHPPDPATCDDGDPCTTDTCDRRAGCSHPPAADGTACGTFSCARAHLCVFGSCRDLDVSGLSNGFPCFDGDPCTEGDACQSGACIPGERVTAEPRLHTHVPTYGGPGTDLATDGERFVFAGDDFVQVVRRETRSGRLAWASAAPAPGATLVTHLSGTRFVVAGGEWLQVIDVATPEQLLLQDRFQAPTGTGGQIRQLLRAPNGVITLSDGSFRGATYLGFDALGMLASMRVLSIGNQLQAIDSDGSRLAWVDVAGDAWTAELTADGRVVGAVRVRPRVGPVTHVSVSGRRLALATAAGIEIVEVVGDVGGPVPCGRPGDARDCLNGGPSCSGSFPWDSGPYVRCDAANGCAEGESCEAFLVETCPNCDIDCDGLCCSDAPLSFCVARTEVRTIGTAAAAPLASMLLFEDELLVADGTGVSRINLSVDPPGERTAWDEPIPATRVTRGGALVVATGAAAIAYERLARNEDSTGRWARVTGPGHGGAFTLVDGATPTSVTLAGAATRGTFDVLADTLTLWTLRSPPAEPTLLRGERRLSLVTRQRTIQPEVSFTSAVCPGVRVSTMNPAGELASHLLCQPGHSILTTSLDHVWSDPSRDFLTNALVTSAPVAHLPEGDACEPVVVGDPMQAPATGIELRGEHASSRVLSIRHPDEELAEFPSLDLAVFAPDSPTPVASGRLDFDDTEGFLGAPYLASAGPLLLRSAFERVDLVRLSANAADAPEHLASLELASAGRSPSQRRIVWWDGRRAWLVSRLVPLFPPTGIAFPYVLEQVAYDAATNTLALDGTLQLDSDVIDLVDVGGVVMAISPSAVDVIAPACH